MSFDPTQDDLRLLTSGSDSRLRGGWSFARLMHPNPHLYKYYWWVFHKGCVAEGAEFRTPRFRLCTHDAFMLRNELARRGEPFFVYNTRLPRLDPRGPFDPQNPKFAEAEWAPSFDDDTDPIFERFR